MSTQFESIVTRAPAIGAEPHDAARPIARRGLSRGVWIAGLAALAWLGSAALTIITALVLGLGKVAARQIVSESRP